MSEVADSGARAPSDLPNRSPAGAEPTATPGTGDPTAGTGTPTPEDQTSTPAERTFTQSELNDIVQRRVAKAQRRTARETALEVENRLLRERVNGGDGGGRTAEPSGPPSLEQFDGDYTKYNEALVDYKVNERLSAHTREQQQAQQKQSAETERRSFLDKGNKKYPEFEYLIMDDNLKASSIVVDFTHNTEHGIDVAWFLANNPAEAERISSLPSAAKQVKELEAIEAQLTRPAIPSTPDPITPSGNNTKVETSLKDVKDPKDFAARRREFIRTNRRR